MNEHSYAISLARANIISLLLLIPLTALYLLPYVSIWGWDKLVLDFSLIADEYLFFLFLIAAGILAHELLHGLTWKLAGDTSWDAIKFGFNWRALAPYAHCRIPLEINAYRRGAAMPGIALGVVPFIIGLVTGAGWYALFGFIFTVTAVGDILILWLTRNIEAGTLVQDHPEMAGCEIVRSNNRNTDVSGL